MPEGILNRYRGIEFEPSGERVGKGGERSRMADKMEITWSVCQAKNYNRQRTFLINLRNTLRSLNKFFLIGYDLVGHGFVDVVAKKLKIEEGGRIDKFRIGSSGKLSLSLFLNFIILLLFPSLCGCLNGNADKTFIINPSSPSSRRLLSSL